MSFNKIAEEPFLSSSDKTSESWFGQSCKHVGTRCSKSSSLLSPLSSLLFVKKNGQKKSSSESRNLERKVAQNSGFVQVVWCFQRFGTMFQGAQSYAFTPSLQCFETLVTLSWEGRNIEIWGATLRVILQNWHLQILQNRAHWVKFLIINDLPKPQNTCIFGDEGLLACKYAILQRPFVKEFQQR